MTTMLDLVHNWDATAMAMMFRAGGNPVNVHQAQEDDDESLKKLDGLWLGLEFPLEDREFRRFAVMLSKLIEEGFDFESAGEFLATEYVD